MTRPISFNERLYLVAENQHPAFCIQLVLEGNGALDKSQLARAVADASAANPGSRLRANSARRAWLTDGPTPPMRVLSSAWDGFSACAELSRALSPEAGPTVEVVLSGPRLVFRCFHGVMDARGLLDFAEDVFRALREEPPLGSSCELTDESLVRRLGSSGLRFLPRANRPSLTGSATNPFDLTMVTARFSLAGARPALVARLAAALARNQDLRAMVPVDLRQYSPGLRDTGNLTLPMFLEVSRGQDWKAIHNSLLRGLARREPLRVDLLSGPGARLPLSILKRGVGAWTSLHRRRNRFPFSVLLSHLAISRSEQLSGGGFSFQSAWFLPQQLDLFPLAVSAISHPAGAEVALSGPRAFLGEERLEGLVAQLKRELG